MADSLIDAAIAALVAPSGGFREAVALRHLGAGACGAVLPLTAHVDARVRGLACFALGSAGYDDHGDPQRLAALLARFSDDHAHVRYAAVATLGELKPREAQFVVSLEKVRQDDLAPDVRSAAAEALFAITGSHPRPVRATDALLADLDSPDATTRIAALGDIGVLGARGELAEAEPRALEALVRSVLGDPTFVNRQRAALALMRAGRAAPPVVEALIHALSDTVQVAAVAVQALGSFGPAARAAAPALEKLRDGGNAVLSELAAGALSKIALPPAPRPFLRRLLGG